MKKRKKGKNNFFEQVYQITKKIPKGKVTTYGQIAKVMGTKDARKVGWALHVNKNKDVPCHRVVNKDGKLASGFAGGGYEEQRNILLKEGVVFKNKIHVDLKKCCLSRV